MNKFSNETIAALATPVGRGGIGVVRVSGHGTTSVAKKIIGFIPKPRYATLTIFRGSNNFILDKGVALYFPNPHSFTGEDILELQGHGGVIVMDQLLESVIKAGARLARPGEFSERAFLNKKMDLLQAEAVFDLINATSEQATRAAMRSLQGEFSERINKLVENLVELRMYIEATIDFPEEEVGFLKDNILQKKLEKLLKDIESIEKTAQQGALLREGITVLIVGEPNVGKSSLLNLLSGQDTAIVTDVAGTTRDILRESIYIDNMLVNLLDTAGLRITENIVEKEGVRRTKKSIEQADFILLVVDNTYTSSKMIEKTLAELFSEKESQAPIIIVKNKIDLTGEEPSKEKSNYTQIKLSVKTGVGIEILREHLKESAGFAMTNEGNFIARSRHCDAIRRSKIFIQSAYKQLIPGKISELIAEDLFHAQQVLSEITGQFSSEDLLKKIFSEFCIGK